MNEFVFIKMLTLCFIFSAFSTNLYNNLSRDEPVHNVNNQKTPIAFYVDTKLKEPSIPKT